MSVTQGNLIYSSFLDYEEIDHSEPSIDDYGLDTMTRTYSGMTSMLGPFLGRWNSPAGVPLNTPDVQFPGMVAVGKPSIGRGRGFSTVTVNFTGKISNKEPLVSIKDTWTENTAQITGSTGSTGDANADFLFPISIDFFAGGATYEYCSATRPTSPRYDGGASLNSIAITTVGDGADGIINTATAHGLSVGDYIVFSGVTGTTPDINDINIVKAVTDTDTFTIETAVTVGGTGGTVTPLDKVWAITRIRGQAYLDSTWYPARLGFATFDQNMTAFTREQEGVWWKCSETWEWKITNAFDTPS